MDFRKLAYDFLNTSVVQPNSLDINQRIFVANLFSLIGFIITFLMGVSAFIRQYNILVSCYTPLAYFLIVPISLVVQGV
jgi:hypothetical protein